MGTLVPSDSLKALPIMRQLRPGLWTELGLLKDGPDTELFDFTMDNTPLNSAPQARRPHQPQHLCT